MGAMHAQIVHLMGSVGGWGVILVTRKEAGWGPSPQPPLPPFSLPPMARLGHFDPANAQPFNSLPATVIGSATHVATARKLAGEGIVLLKNQQVGRSW